MPECCSNCVYYRRLKHNFKRGVGFEESHCCVMWIKTDDDSISWVQEVDAEGMCEMYRGKEDEIQE